MERQLIIVADMEGASGIFERNAAVLRHGSREWYEEGRDLITSDVLAVCEAANEFGIEEMLIMGIALVRQSRISKQRNC